MSEARTEKITLSLTLEERRAFEREASRIGGIPPALLIRILALRALRAEAT